MSQHFADRINQQILNKKTSIMLGIDPNFDLMPKNMRPVIGDRHDLKDKLWYFCKTLMDQTHDLVCGIKPQSAYFEQYGTAGIEVLAQVIDYARQLDLPILMDVKRGDIGATSDAYSKAYLSPTIYGSDLEADALTVNPFLGLDTLEPFVQSANAGKGVFVLVKTSNPGAAFIQDSLIGAETVSHALAKFVNEKGNDSVGELGYSNVGAVVGATHSSDALELRKIMPKTIFLAPGVGAQGGDIAAIKDLMDYRGLGVVVPISRGINYPKLQEGQKWEGAVREECQKFVSFFR
jgi:orotidine-5'-phosphate decarboxylase